jgi:hypothetical protein
MRLKGFGPAPIPYLVGKSGIWLWATVGGTIGGAVPMLWGAGALSLVSFLFSIVGSGAGVWFGARLADT